MERVGDAFVWPFRDPKWVEKVAIIGLIGLIPIVGSINGLGWLLASLDRLREGKHELPPGNFDYLGRGVLLFVVLLIYTVVVVFVCGALLLAGIVLLGTGEHNGLLQVLGLLVTFAAFGVTVVATLAFFFARPAIVLATDARGISGGLDVPAIVRTMRVSPTSTLIAGLMLLAAGFISQLGSYACVVGLIFTVPYALAMEAWIIRSYEEALDVGRSAAPTAAPER